MCLTPGARLGPYEVRSLVGAGGMGEVYEARDSRLDRRVAIKVLPESLAADPARRRRFEKEARAASALSHPHICALHDIGVARATSGGPELDYLVMEYVEGQTLAERLASGPLPLDLALTCAIQVADALSAAHRAGIVHRDLKPGNILLGKSGGRPHATLLDFGLARLGEVTGAGSDTATLDFSGGAAFGTAPYMAPEQVQGFPADARTDIFAFGAVVYEMVSGTRAFAATSAASTAAAILNRDPPPLSQVQPIAPPALARLVSRCLAKDPDDRWQDARDLCHELSAIQEDLHAPPPAVGFRRHLRATVFVMGAVVVAVLALRWPVAQRPATEDRASFRRLSVTLPAHAPVASASALPLMADKPVLALSPGGSLLAYVAEREGQVTQLFLADLAAGTVRPLPGTEGGHTPAFSPDGSHLAFFARERLNTLSRSGGVPRVLAERASNPCGICWGTDGFIYFNRMDGEGILRIGAGGGDVEPVTATSYTQMPEFLGIGRGLLAREMTGGGGVVKWYGRGGVSRTVVNGRARGTPAAATWSTRSRAR